MSYHRTRSLATAPRGMGIRDRAFEGEKGETATWGSFLHGIAGCSKACPAFRRVYGQDDSIVGSCDDVIWGMEVRPVEGFDSLEINEWANLAWCSFSPFLTTAVSPKPKAHPGKGTQGIDLGLCVRLISLPISSTEMHLVAFYATHGSIHLALA